jgi:ABC-type antimicrobial peptide transport system permease subunit
LVAARKSTKLRSKGNKSYGLSYALSTIRAHPFRAISLALTLSLGISLFASTMVWADTGVYVSIYEYLEAHSYQLSITADSGHSQDLRQAESYMQQDPLVECTYRMNSTVGLVWGTELPNATLYDIDGPIYSQGLKDCRVSFVDNDFLSITAHEFWYQGEFELQEGEIIVSSEFIIYVQYVFNTTLQLGDKIDIELLTGSGMVGPVEIGDLGRLSFTNLTIVGIYDPKTGNSMLEQAMPSQFRENLIISNILYPVLGLRDNVFILKDAISPGTLSENGFILPSTLVRLSAAGLAAAGPENVATNLFAMASRTEERFHISWLGSDKISEIQNTIDTYISTLSLSILALPVILLALFFSVFAADTFMAPRTVEVGVIRSKGASYSQVSAIFLWETLIISSIAVIMGIVFSILFAPLIPASISFMVFDWSVYTFYISNTVLTSSTILRAIGLTVLPSMLFILYLARKAAQTEISLTLMEVTEDPNEQTESHGFTIGASVVLLVLVIIMIIILPKMSVFFMMELALGTAAWFFIAYNGSKVSRVGLAKISAKMAFLLGQKNIISAGYLKMRKGRIIPLMVVLCLTMSTTIAFAVQSESLRVDLNREIEYAIGADLRIDCTLREFSFSNIVGNYTGVNTATPVLRTWARVGSETLSIEALYADRYAQIGDFDQSSFDGIDPSVILSELAETPNGIIISEYHAALWNKTVGSTLNLEMSGVGTNQIVQFIVIGVVHSAPGFGFASVTTIPASSLGAGFGFQAEYEGFAIANIQYIASVIKRETTDLFLADLQDNTNRTGLAETLRLLPGVYPIVPEEFDLKSQSLYTTLFLNTVEGLFSIGFVMSLILSIFALSISLGSVVRERRKEYAVIRAIGGSRRQVVSMVFSEFTGVVLASLVLSLLLGAIFAYVMGLLLNNMSPFSRILAATISFPVPFLSSVLLIEIATMIIGSFLPAREASRTEPAVVLRNM